jgi:hypothetical protein
MSSVFPGALDGLSDVSTGQLVTAANENDQTDAINAIESNLGVNAQGSYSTLGAAIAGKLDIASATMGGNIIHDLGTPSASTDAATKAYVDAASMTLNVDSNGTLTSSRSTLNFIPSGVATISVVDNPTSNRTDITIGAPSGGSGGSSTIYEDLGCVIDGGGAVPATGLRAFRRVDYACTIVEVDIIADQSGSAVVDIWKAAYPTLPTSSGSSITGGSPPTLSSSQTVAITSFSGWSTLNINAGDVLGFNLNSASTVNRITVVLKVQRTVNTLGGTVVDVYETIGLTIDGDGGVPATGFQAGAIRRVDYNCTITGWTLIGNASGSAVVDVWVVGSLSSVPGMSGSDSICASALPTLSSAQTASSITLTGWTTSLATGDFVGFNLSSISGISRLMLALTVQRT